PITQVADYVLINGHRQGQLQGDSIGTKIAQLFVLDLIYALIVQAEEENATEVKQKTVNVILEQRIK
ncbi:N-acetylmannosamine kinase, partial [Avibacterium paragallinarum]